MARPLEDTHRRGGTPIFMATTATPTILATTATIPSTPPCLVTGTITKLVRRGEAMTRSQLVEHQPTAGTLTQRHGRLIETVQQRVESPSPLWPRTGGSGERGKYATANQ